MRSLSSILRSDTEGDEVARSLQAVIDSGMILSVRDSGGRFVQTSSAYGDALGVQDDVRGTARLPGQRFFSPDGRELSLREHPSHVVRTTGEPQRNVVVGVRAAQTEAWFKLSYMALDRGPEGWSVLSVGADITEEWTRMRAAEADAERQRQLVELALRLSGRQVTGEEAAAALADTVAAGLPGAGLYVVLRHDMELEAIAVRNAYGPRPQGSSKRIRVTAETAARWASGATHVNLDVQDTDIYGGKVAVEWATKPGSLVTVPVLDPTGAPYRATLVATSEARGAFSEEQIEVLERAARLIGPSLSLGGQAAAA